jgi:hypothetical protein
MAKSRKIGVLGLSVPVINPSNTPKMNMTTDDVLKWRAALPMADIGLASKKLYIALSELNETHIDPVTRFHIMELFRRPTKTIATALKKHYIEQAEPLTQQKLIIATLRQTLITEVADNYKTVLEELHSKPTKTEEEQQILITAICRILYYLNAFLLCRYQIYSYVPENIWQEIHNLYKYSLKNNILDAKCNCELSFNHNTSIIGAYTRILLLSATDPYQWRQKDQYSISKALDLWAIYPTIYDNEHIPEKDSGIYIVDLDKDEPPIAFNFKRDPITKSCIALDVAKNVKHLKHLLLKMHNNEMKLRINHPGDAEFSVTIPILVKLIQIWSQKIVRHTQRFRIAAKIKVAFGLRAAYYYINNEKEFDPNPSHINAPVSTRHTGSLARPSLALPIFEIEEDEEEGIAAGPIGFAKPPAEPVKEEIKEEVDEEPTVDIEKRYHIYDYIIENISTNGFCILVEDGSFPPFRAGEIMIFKNSNESADAPWSIGAVRWIKSPRDGAYQIGIELVAPFAKAAGIQMIRNDQPAGLLLRCLILADEPGSHSVLLTPTLPLQSNKVILYIDDQPGIRTTLVKELEATSGYHKYAYSSKEAINITEPKHEEQLKKQDATETVDEDQTNTEFDSIWKDL